MIRLSRRYAAGLRKHLKQGPHSSLEPALNLGRQAVAIGLETLDIARIHRETLDALESKNGQDGFHKRAERFFTEAIIPIEQTHDLALKTNLHLSRLNKTLGLRTVELAATKRSLKRGIAQRKLAEKALRKSSSHSENLLKESRDLQKHLQHLAHRILSAQEDKRKKISLDLQDEIAQTLLGIKVRLSTLRKVSAVDARRFKKAVASTQQLVDKSVRSIDHFVQEFRLRHET